MALRSHKRRCSAENGSQRAREIAHTALGMLILGHVQASDGCAWPACHHAGATARAQPPQRVYAAIRPRIHAPATRAPCASTLDSASPAGIRFITRPANVTSLSNPKANDHPPAASKRDA